MKIRNKEKSISQIVEENTGMTVEQLIDDKRVWTYDFHELFELLEKKKPKRIIIFGDYDDDGVLGLPKADLIFDAHFDGKSNITEWCAGGVWIIL